MTEPYGIDDVSPCSGCLTSGWVSVQLRFNSAMDTASVRTCFMLGTYADEEVEGELTWHQDNSVMSFNPTGELAAGAYKITLTNGARNESGALLAEAFESYFVVVE